MPPASGGSSSGRRRKKRSHRKQQSLRGAPLVFDRLLVGLLFVASAGACIYFGGTRAWSAGPYMVLTFMALALYALRVVAAPLKFPLYRVPGSSCWGAWWLYVAVRACLTPVMPLDAGMEVLYASCYLATFFLWVQVCQVRKRRRWIAGAFLILVSLLAWYAVVQHINGSRMVLFVERPLQYKMRASGTYLCPNHYAQLLQMAVCLALALVLARGVGAVIRLISGYTLAISLPALLLTGSRSAWLGTLAGMAVILLADKARRGWRSFLITLLALPVAALALGAGLWYGSAMFRERVGNMLNGNIRWGMWQDTLSMISAKPLFGHGAGSYRYVFPEYREHFSESSLYLRYAHNEILHTLAEFGWMGLLLVGLATGVVLYSFVSRYFKASDAPARAFLLGGAGVMIGAQVHALFDYNFHIFANVQILAMLLALSLVDRSGEGLKEGRKGAPSWGRLAGTALLLAALVGGYFSLRSWRGSSLEKRMELQADPEHEGYDMESALASAQSALQWNPLLPGPYRTMGDEYLKRSIFQMVPTNMGAEIEARGRALKAAKMEQAETAYQAALHRNSRDLKSLLGRARLAYDKGEVEPAMAQVEHIISWDPYNVLYRHQLGEMQQRHGLLEEARATYLAAKEIDPKNKTTNLNLRKLRKKLNPKPKRNQ